MTTRVGVISDTHLNRVTGELTRLYEQYLVDKDILLHAGDFVSIEVLDFFSKEGFQGVCGNMDHHAVKQRLPEKRVLEIEGHRIGLVHGWGSPFGIEQRIRSLFQGVEAIIYGHSHRSSNHVVDGILFFNPGPACGSRPGGNGIGILEVDEEIRPELIEL